MRVCWLLGVVACGTAAQPPAPPAYAIPAAVRAPAPVAPRPEGVIAWLHADHALDWLEAYRALHTDTLAVTKNNPLAALSLPEDRPDWAAVAAALAPDEPFDVAVHRRESKYETAFALALADEPAFEAALGKAYRVEPVGRGFDLLPKTPVDPDPDVPPPVALLHCEWEPPLLSCTTVTEPSAELRAWLRSKPRSGGKGITAELDPAALRPDLQAFSSKLKSAELRTAADAFDAVRFQLNVMPSSTPSLATSLSFHFRPEAAGTFLFRGGGDTRGMQHLLAHWPADATLTLVSTPPRHLVVALEQDLASVGQKDQLGALAEHSMAIGTVVEAGVLRQAAADTARVPLDWKALEAHRLRLHDALGGYGVGAIAPSDSGSPLTTAQVAKVLAHDTKTVIRAPRAARVLPKGSLFIPDSQVPGLPPTTEGMLLVPGPDGTVWTLFSGRESYLVEAAQRLLAQPAQAVDSFPAGSLARALWSPAFGSYWQIPTATQSFLPQKAPKTKGAASSQWSAPGRTIAEAREELVKSAKEIEVVVTRPRLAPMALDLTAVGSTRTVLLAGQPRLDTLSTAAGNAAGPLSLAMFSAVMLGTTLLTLATMPPPPPSP